MTEKLRELMKVTDHTPVLRVRKTGESAYNVETGGENPGSRVFDRIIFTVPLPLLSGIIADFPEALGRSLKNVKYNPSIVVALALSRPFADHSFMNRFLQTQIHTLATVVQDHDKGGERVPKGKGLVTVVLTKEASSRLFDKPDGEVSAAVLREADKVWPGIADEVLFYRIYRWPFGGVQLPPGALASQTVMRNELETLNPDWAFAGDGLFRASMEVSLRTGFKAAERILQPRQ